MKKEIKDYLHFYLGCECEAETLMADYSWKYKRQDTLTPEMLSGIHRKVNRVKPILRPLSDMTKKESNIGDEIMNTFDENNPIEAMQGMANMTMYLLKQGFDLFNLIPEGLAIDKTKIVAVQPGK